MLHVQNIRQTGSSQNILTYTLIQKGMDCHTHIFLRIRSEGIIHTRVKYVIFRTLINPQSHVTVINVHQNKVRYLTTCGKPFSSWGRHRMLEVIHTVGRTFTCVIKDHLTFLGSQSTLKTKAYGCCSTLIINE